MQAVEFDSVLTNQGELPVPKEFAPRLPRSQKVHVIVLFSDSPEGSSEDVDWSRLTARQFLNGYAPSDSIYDEE